MPTRTGLRNIDSYFSSGALIYVEMDANERYSVPVSSTEILLIKFYEWKIFYRI